MLLSFEMSLSSLSVCCCRHSPERYSMSCERMLALTLPLPPSLAGSKRTSTYSCMTHTWASSSKGGCVCVHKCTCTCCMYTSCLGGATGTYTCIVTLYIYKLMFIVHSCEWKKNFQKFQTSIPARWRAIPSTHRILIHAMLWVGDPRELHWRECWALNLNVCAIVMFGL